MSNQFSVLIDGCEHLLIRQPLWRVPPLRLARTIITSTNNMFFLLFFIPYVHSTEIDGFEMPKISILYDYRAITRCLMIGTRGGANVKRFWSSLLFSNLESLSKGYGLRIIMVV